MAVSPDDGTGGDDALDIYFLPIDANGYAYPLRDAAPDGGAACYIELDSGINVMCRFFPGDEAPMWGGTATTHSL